LFPDSSDPPYIVLNQSWDSEPNYQLGTRYSGIGGAIVGNQSGGNDYLHIVTHAEDSYWNGSFDPSKVYNRVGYARSTATGSVNDAYYLTRLTTTDADPLPTSTPPVGGWGGALLTAPYTETEGRTITDYSGLGQPHILYHSPYYYLFFSDYKLGPDLSGNEDLAGISVARIHEQDFDIPSSSYQSTTNKWKKKYNNNWNEPGLGGNADTLVSWEWGPKVSWNLEHSMWVMVTYNRFGIYIHFSSASTPDSGWNSEQGSGILLKTSNFTNEYIYPTLMGSNFTGASDKVTDWRNSLFYGKIPQGGQPGQHTLWKVRLKLL